MQASNARRFWTLESEFAKLNKTLAKQVKDVAKLKAVLRKVCEDVVFASGWYQANGHMFGEECCELGGQD